MIEELRRFDNRTAAGLLARAALALEDADNPAAKPTIPDENAVRNILISAARKSLGLSQEDNSPEALEQIGDYLDEQAEYLMGPNDDAAALLRLAERGALPTDMYQITCNPGLTTWYGKNWPLELRLVEKTIRQPSRQQHFGKSDVPGEPSFVSLFYRSFKTRWPFKDFNLLVVASRNGMVLSVGQSWRFYPSLIDVSGAENLVDLLSQFARQYGMAVDYAGKTGSFFVAVDNPNPNPSFKVEQLKQGRRAEFTIAQLTQHVGGKLAAYMAVVVDMIKYKAVLDQMGVDEADILDLSDSGVVEKLAFNS
jgi:hypothetical protein